MGESYYLSPHDKPPLDSSSSDTRSMALLRHPEISDEEAVGCARFLAGRARDAAELRRLLEMLGLLPYDAGETYRFGQAPKTPAVPSGGEAGGTAGNHEAAS